MSGQGRPQLLPLLAALGLLGSVGRVTTGSEPPPPVAADLAADASLADIFFTDPLHGWAVGDRGVIWSTSDGGRNWILQPSGVGCRLESVWFTDENNGWAAGGWTHPYTHKTTGVILRTLDGGRRWTTVERHLLPKLKRVRFTDARHGWVLGVASALYRSGVWRTADGGQSFTPVPGDCDSGWITGDLVDEDTMALVGANGRTACAVAGRLTPLAILPPDSRDPRCARLRSDGVGLAVGDGGRVLVTVDPIRRWEEPAELLPQPLARHFDFSAVCLVGSHAWIAGSPGTVVFHTSDGGRTWATQATGQSLPIYSLCFVDEQRGWAAGALGTILATEDAGQTWQRQRGAARAAALAVFGTAEAVPLAALAQLSGNQGYLTAVEVLGRCDRDASPLAEGLGRDHAREAFVLAGASDARVDWPFPIPGDRLQLPVEQIVESWKQAGGSDAVSQAEQRLVRAIQQWRPTVVLTHAAAEDEPSPLDAMMQELVLRAVQRAAVADPAVRNPPSTGLDPWRVRRVYGVVGETTDGDVVLTTGQLSPRLGQSLAEQATAARALIASEPATPPVTLAARLLLNEMSRTFSAPAATESADFFRGIYIEPDGQARRQHGPLPVTGMAALRKQVQLRRNLEQLLANTSVEDQTAAARLGQIAQLVRGLGADGAAGLLHQLAARHHIAGQGELAAETYEWLANRYADHPLTESALLWLIRYYASGEVTWRLSQRSRVTVRQVSSISPLDSPFPSLTPPGQTWQPDAGDRAATKLPELEPMPAEPRDEVYRRARQALRVAEWIHSTRPALAAEPAVGLPEAAAERQLGRKSRAQQIYRRIVGNRAEDAWWRCAQAELPPEPGTSHRPKARARCVRVATQPVLDGKLEEPLWSGAEPIDLTGSAAAREPWPARVRLAHDDEYLYVAVECRRAEPVTPEPPPTAQPRDPDLSREDRVDLLIDIDRDYATFYRLTVDHRGFTGEACFGDAGWDPKWFVAANPAPTLWTVEAAIPLRELTARPPGNQDAWAIGLQRTVPGAGFQSWTRPAGIDILPHGFGLLVFE